MEAALAAEEERGWAEAAERGWAAAAASAALGSGEEERGSGAAAEKVVGGVRLGLGGLAGSAASDSVSPLVVAMDWVGAISEVTAREEAA